MVVVLPDVSYPDARACSDSFGIGTCPRFFGLAHVLNGEPASTSPEHALENKRVADGTGVEDNGDCGLGATTSDGAVLDAARGCVVTLTVTETILRTEGYCAA